MFDATRVCFQQLISVHHELLLLHNTKHEMDDGFHEEMHGPSMVPQHGEGKRVFAQDDLRRLAERDTNTQRALAAAEARRDALQRMALMRDNRDNRR